MLKDFLLGEHLLLVGNQGVGKNKIVDRFLFLLNRPREYLQLHRCQLLRMHAVRRWTKQIAIRFKSRLDACLQLKDLKSANTDLN